MKVLTKNHLVEISINLSIPLLVCETCGKLNETDNRIDTVNQGGKNESFCFSCWSSFFSRRLI